MSSGFSQSSRPLSHHHRRDACRRARHRLHLAPRTGEFRLGAGTFTPGCYVPWKCQTWYDRTVYTPAGGGLEGWANDPFCMDRCDGDPARFRWRDGGHIAYLPAPDNWSPCITRKDGAGDSGPTKICNAHNDFHHPLFVPELKKVDGASPYRDVHRLLWLPPELTRQAWDNARRVQQGNSGMIIMIGEVEAWQHVTLDFDSPAWGLAFNIAFHAEYCDDYLDDFALRMIDKEKCGSLDDGSG